LKYGAGFVHYKRLKTAPASKVEQLAALTGLRGFAALWVVSLHFLGDTNTLLPASTTFNWFMGAGSNAVPLFFVLSGFILLHTYHGRFNFFSWREYFRFIGLRLARIYPAYLAALVAMVLLVAASRLTGAPYNHGAYPLQWLPAEVFMLHSWVVMPSPFTGWNYPDWSVSAEWFAYLFVFPLAVWLVKKISGARNITVALLALILCALEPAIRTEWKLSTVSLLFIAGALLWDLRRRLVSSGWKIPPHLDALAFTLLLATVWSGSFISWKPAAFGILLAVMLLIFGLCNEDGIFSRLLATPPCIFLGEISYSIYLIHGCVLRLAKVLLPAQKFTGSTLPVRSAICLTELSAVLLSATLLYFLVEHPARNWLRRIFSRPQTYR